MYLIVLAYSEKLLAILPDVVVPTSSDINNVGVWTWGNGLRTLIPWNMPLVAMAIYGAIAVVMVRSGPWIPVVELDPKKLQRLKEKEEKEEVPGSVLATDMLFRFGPALLAVAAILLGTLAVGKSDLKGKTILAYEKGYLNWLKPEYDSPIAGRYGMLPPFVESLGGKFDKSKDLSKQELDTADVLLLIHPDEPWPKDRLERVWDFVRRGGSLLLVAEPAIHEGDSLSSFNDVLQPLAMKVRFDTAVTRSGNWEQSYDVSTHPATAGIDDLRNWFGVQLGSSIRICWPARPVLVGRWGWSDPGNDAVVHRRSRPITRANRWATSSWPPSSRWAPGGSSCSATLRRCTTRCWPILTLSSAVCWPIWPIGRRVRRPSGGSCWRWRRSSAMVGAVGRPPGGVAVDAHAVGDGRFVDVLHGGRVTGRAAFCRKAAQAVPAARTISPTSTLRIWMLSAATAATCRPRSALPAWCGR